MKKIGFLLIGITLLFSSCAVHNGLTYNGNSHTTEVVLSKKNFKVVAQVKGEATATYIFGIGGLSKNGLIEEAKADMLSKANILGDSKAIVNETVEVKRTFILPFCIKQKVIVSGHVIEFTE